MQQKIAKKWAKNTITTIVLSFSPESKTSIMKTTIIKKMQYYNKDIKTQLN